MARYINREQLTDNIIEGIMNRCGLELIREAVDDHTGKTVEINPIERMDEMIMVKCRNLHISELANMVYGRFPIFGMFNTSAYSLGDEIVILEDYFASRFKIVDELDELDKQLFEEYTKTMSLLFGKEYIEDSQKCYSEVLAQSEQKSVEKGE